MSSIVIAGDTSGTCTLQANAVAGTVVLTLPTTSGTLVSTTTPINASAITSGTLAVAYGGTGANTLTGYVKGSGTSAMTASATVPTSDLTGTLGVANGGTGAATLTANNVILGNGTSAVQVVAPGTSGNVLTSNGTTWTSTAPAGAQLQYSLATRAAASNSSGTPLVWNSTGNLTWTCPTGVTKVKLLVIGGGTGINNFGGFNGSGGLGVGVYTVTPGTAYSVTVGAAGAGLTGTSSVPAGGTSSFGSLLSATGGSGGNGGGTNGSAANGNLRNVSTSVWQPLGGAQPTAGGSGSRTATIDWAIDTTQGAPGATNPDDGYAISGVVLIEYVG